MKNLTLFLMLAFSISLQAQVLGFVEGDKTCSAPTEVFVAQKKNLLFQIHVPVGGTFEVKLNPGQYNIIAVNQDGCEAKKEFDLQKDQVSLSFKIRKPASERTPTSIWGSVGETGMPVAPNGFLFGGGFRSPWWYPWSMYQYPVSYPYPCMWNIWGCGGGNYPGGGPIVMGKPNIYVEGPNVENAKIELPIVDGHRLMATAPAHMEKGWTFDLEKNQMKVSGTVYPYLFYDSRAEVKNLVNSQNGYCGDRKFVLQKMSDTLEQLHFPKKAQKDFNEHWWAKLPQITLFCVYPQVNEQLAELAPLKISFSSYSLTRVAFFIIPKPKRSKLPQEAFLREMVQRTPASWTAPVLKEERPPKKWQVYEWGVAFPFENEKK
jgi:hypothetical protein